MLQRNDSADRILTDACRRLDELERRDDDASWEKAGTYLKAYNELQEEPKYKSLRGQKLTHKINNAFRAKRTELGLIGPRVSFLSHARKLGDTWPEVFGSGTKDLPYQHYRQMAVCSLPLADRNMLRQWAETTHPTRENLRLRIRHDVDAYNLIYKPDFELRVSNFWKFNSHHDNSGFGGVHPAIYANLIHWFTQPGDTVLDPMAGSGLLQHTLQAFRYFRESYEAEGSGKRIALMSDIAPKAAKIKRADARKQLPFKAGCAKLAILDPPYFRIADKKDYTNLGKNLDEWLRALKQIGRNVQRCLQKDGLIAIMTDDVLRKDNHQPIAYLITSMFINLGFKPQATIYNHNPNFVYTMGPAMMKAAKSASILCNGCKIIQVLSK